MSDIFISYSKADHALALKLSAFLEAEGWSVWWDKSLAAADLYRDEIMKQLAAARAVITIWTENSVKSDWVRAEAGRAKADGKLIPVKTTDVAYADIPLPFGEMHTENVGSTDLIRAAIVAQLAKPAVKPSTFWQITGVFKYQLLTWIGIVGSAITLFANFNGVLTFADWARELVAHWHEWNQIFWGWIFSLIGLRVPRTLVPIISFIASISILVAGVNLSARTIRMPDKSQHAIPFKRKVWLVIGGYFVILPGFLFAAFLILAVDMLGVFSEQSVSSFAVVMLFLAYFGSPMAYLLYLLEKRSLVVVNSILFLFMTGCLLWLPQISFLIALEGEPASPDSPESLALAISVMILSTCWVAVILFSPLEQLTRRLGFVVLGVVMLVGLSEISKFNLHQYLQPPKVSDNSVR